MNFKIRRAAKEDCKDISRMIMDLAIYEKMPDQVKISHEELERDGFCQNPFFECLIAEVPEEHKSNEGFTVIGYALYFYTYSTWKGRAVYLEDLYVMSEFRGNGIGTALLSKVAEQHEAARVSDVTKRRRLAWIAAVRRADIQFSSISRYLLVLQTFSFRKPAYEMDEAS